VLEFTLPINSSISFGLLPAEVILDGLSIIVAFVTPC